MHEGVKPFSCQFCKQKFRRNDQLKNHLRRKHAADAQADAKKIIYLWEKRKRCNDVRSAEKKSCWKKSSEKITKNSTWGVFLSLRFFVCSKSQKGEWVALFRLCFGPKWVVDLFSVSFFFFLWVIILFLEIPRYQFFLVCFFPLFHETVKVFREGEFFACFTCGQFCFGYIAAFGSFKQSEISPFSLVEV